MKVLITGNKGFVGAATQRLLESQGHKVIGYDLLDRCDIRDKSKFEEIVSIHEPDRILHLTAVARFADADKNPIVAFETNAIGTRNVSRVASDHHIPLVYASTGSVYMPVRGEMPISEDYPVAGNSIYGCSKLVGENYVKQSRSPWMILRYGHLYGAEKRGHGLIGGYLDAIKSGRNPKLFGGNQTNDFMYVDDVARANVIALLSDKDKWDEVYNVGTGVELSAKEAGEIVCEVFGYDGPVDIVPQRNVDPDRFVLDCKKASLKLGFTAEVSFKEGLLKMKEVMGETRRTSYAVAS